MSEQQNKLNSYVYNGQCKCGAVTFLVTFTNPINAYQPRACDCDFCLAKNIVYMSDCEGQAHIKTSATLLHVQQGSNQAEFITCEVCKNVIAATYAESEKRIGAINATLLDSKFDIPPPVVASPKLLNAKDKLSRWKTIWMPISLASLG